MLALLRSLLVLTVALAGSSGAFAASKAFQTDQRDEAAVTLEEEFTEEAGVVSKSLATLKKDADAAIRRKDARAASDILVKVIAVEPEDAASWLRYARTVLLITPKNDDERSALIGRVKTAAYRAYTLTADRNLEAEALTTFGAAAAGLSDWRPALDALRLSLALREVPSTRADYETLREKHGFRIVDYSVDSDAASPRLCFQFSEELPGKRTDFSPFVQVEGQAKPALTADGTQLCVEGLAHGSTYAVTLRPGLPSTVEETLTKPASYSVYVRDRKPAVRFSGRAYVLPRSGQQGIPLVSVNTRKVKAQIFRIGDRSLIDAVLGSDFQRNLAGYEIERLGTERGQKVWSGEVDVETALNKEVTTAFPLDQAIGAIEPGVYVISAYPAETPTEEWESRSAQWFIVSDLGLTAFSGADGINAFVHSLASAEVKSGIGVRLLARNNEVLAERMTDEGGRAHFEGGLTRGEGGLAPAMLVASEPNADYAFLNLTTPSFDLTDRGVAGRAAPAGLDAFVFAERGVYRTGETVHLTALLRDEQIRAVAGAPLTLVMERPDGVEYRREVLSDQGLGGRAWDVPILASAPTGTWRVQAFTDPKRPAVGETSFLVEDYVPDRLEFTLASKAGTIGVSTPAEIEIDGRYLYGAPAGGLTLEGEIAITPTASRPTLDGYVFGLDDDETTPESQPLAELPETDKDGKARFAAALDKLPDTTRPLQAKIVVRMAEAGGRAVERNLVLPVTPSGPMIGIKPNFSGKSLGDGEAASFDIVMVASDGSKLGQPGLRYELLRIEQRYQWYRDEGSWQFEPVKQTSRVADGTVDVSAETPGRISLPVAFGRYRLEVKADGPQAPISSIAFDAGWQAVATADTPDLLEIALDKPEYKPGDTLTVAITARIAGKATIAIAGDRLITLKTEDVTPGTVTVPVTVGEDWGSGAYVVATLRRPLDAEAKRMPGRAIGVQWFAIDKAARSLTVELQTPEVARPEQSLKVPVKVGGLKEGDEARIVVAAVDVGILNLTNYKPPAPDDHYLGQRRLSTEIRDLYGQLIDGMQGNRGQIRTGGDGGALLEGSPPTQPPLALYSGIVTVGADGTAEISFDLPAFAGTARVMAVAWSKDRVGRADKDVIVRDPVVVTASMPRFLLSGDRATFRLDLDNIEGAPGGYHVRLATDGALLLEGLVQQTITLDAKQRHALTMPITTAGIGGGSISLQVDGPGGFTLARSYPLTVKPAGQILARRTVTPLAQGESLTLSKEAFVDLVAGTQALALSVGPAASLDAATLLKALDRYPYGCSEQITSRAIALLYVNDLAKSAALSLDRDADTRIKDAIALLMTRQSSSGSFGSWGAGGDDLWLDAYVSDFLTRAKEQGYAVPDTAFRLALDRLRNTVANASEPAQDGGRGVAYALYVLARNGAAPLGDLRYLADSKLADVATPIAKAQLAAALGMLGDATRADRVYAAALAALQQPPASQDEGRPDYGSALRDAAALLTLASEGGAPQTTIANAFGRVEVARQGTGATSTQENAWLVLAAHALQKQDQSVSVELGGTAHKGPLYEGLTPDDLDDPITVTNTGGGPLQAVVTVTGAPVTPEPSVDRGFGIEQTLYTLAGEPVEATRVKQNDRLVVVLRVTEPKPRFGRLMLVDFLPAGFEIDNPRLVSSGDTGTLDWIEDAAEPVHTEFRDDRFVAAFDRDKDSAVTFSVAYVVRAVTPGSYVLPAAMIEDMYRPDRFGRTGTGKVEVVPAR